MGAPISQRCPNFFIVPVDEFETLHSSIVIYVDVNWCTYFTLVSSQYFSIHKTKMALLSVKPCQMNLDIWLLFEKIWKSVLKKQFVRMLNTLRGIRSKKISSLEKVLLWSVWKGNQILKLNKIFCRIRVEATL